MRFVGDASPTKSFAPVSWIRRCVADASPMRRRYAPIGQFAPSAPQQLSAISSQVLTSYDKFCIADEESYNVYWPLDAGECLL